MSTDISESAAPRRKGKLFIIAGVVFGGLGLLTLLWIAEPVISSVGAAITDKFATLLYWDVPAWVAKLIMAAVLFTIAGLLLLVGGWRWVVSALRARSRGTGPANPGLAPFGAQESQKSLENRPDVPHPGDQRMN